MSRLPLVLVLSALLVACQDDNKMSENTTAQAPAPAAAPVRNNPLLNPSTLPYQAPPFDQIQFADYKPAFEAGMKQHIEQTTEIANNPEPPTFANTIEALEYSGDTLQRANLVFFNLTESNSNEEIQGLETELAPRLAAHSDDILLNPKLFARVEAVYNERATLGLDPEALRLVERTYVSFVRAGAKLDDAAKTKLRALNEEQSSLMTKFGENLLKDTSDLAVIVDNKEALSGLSDADMAAAAEEAKSRGLDGKYALTLQLPSSQGVIGALNDRQTRKMVYEASIARGNRGNAFDNKELVKRLVALRVERAALLGYKDHASFVLEDQMAQTPDAVYKMLGDMAPAIVQNANAEAVEIQKAIDADNGGFKAEPWDWSYYAEKVRKAKFDLDESAIKPYFEFESVLQNGVFFTMNKQYGVTFKERSDLPVYHPDVRVFEVFDADNSPIGLFYADYFARAGKRGGAWMNVFVEQDSHVGTKPVVVNVMSIVKAPAGQKTLVSYDEVSTMFHEMGHGVHGLFSNTKYRSLSGTNVPRDFVEFPSQFQEDWSLDPEVLASYAKHFETGAAMPAELIEKISKARTFNQGFASLEYIAAALLDMEWHTTTKPVDDVNAFEAAALKKHGVDSALIPPRYKTTYFSHVFPGGYSAGYYAYLWSETLAADAFEHIGQNGGLTRANGDKFRAEILSRGNTEASMNLYTQWRGGEPSTDAVLIRRGLKKPGQSWHAR